MATVKYPSNLIPSPLVKEYNLKESNRILKTEMGDGYTVFRKRFTNIPSVFNVSFLFKQNELDFFQAWYKEEINLGQDFFNMDLAVGKGPTVEHECRFLNNPVYKLNGILWEVKVEVQAIQLIVSTTNYDSVIIGVIDTLGGLEESSIYFDKLDVFVNTTFPASGYGPNA